MAGGPGNRETPTERGGGIYEHRLHVSGGLFLGGITSDREVNAIVRNEYVVSCIAEVVISSWVSFAVYGKKK